MIHLPWHRVVFVLVALLPSAALAQAKEGGMPNLPPPVIIAAPPAVEGGANVSPPPAMPGRVPELPPSRACTQADIAGFWKLLQVYEEPSGPETTAFYSMQSQYALFKPDSTFETYERDKDLAISVPQLLAIMKEQNKSLQQYVVQSGGQLYYYRDGVASKQQACFIVATSNSYFAEGQMLLMPPNTQALTRWVKVYSKIFIQQQKTPIITPPREDAEVTTSRRGKRNNGASGEIITPPSPVTYMPTTTQTDGKRRNQN